MEYAEYKENIKKFRNEKIIGDIVDLVPYSNKFLNDVIAVRNTDRAKYYLNQGYDLTEEQQLKWYENYLKRDNDIYWVIINKKNEFIGTTGLYDIDFIQKRAEKGRQIIIKEKAFEAPYALEAEILLLGVAFEQFILNEIIIYLKKDNEKVESMNLKFGFKKQKETIIREKVYNQYILEKIDFHPEKFDKIIEHWKKRNT